MDIVKSYHFLGGRFAYAFYLWNNNKVTKQITLFDDKNNVISMDTIEITGATLEEVILDTVIFEVG